MKKPTSKTALMLVKASKQTEPKETTPKPVAKSDLSKLLLRFPDQDAAMKIIQSHTESGCDREQPQRARLLLQQSEVDRRHKASDKKLVELDNSVNATPRYIKRCADETGKESQKPFTQWETTDQLSCIVLVVALIVALAMSAANIFANLIASGEAVFIENPLIAVLISLLAPCGSIAFKFIGHAFEHYKNIKRYCNTIYVLTTISFLIWVALFSMSFNGIAGGVEWDELGESSSLGSWLMFVQLLTEILVGGSLCLALQDISLKYVSELFRENPAYDNAVTERDAHLKQHQILTEQRNELHTQLTQINAERQATINLKLAEFIDKRSRFSEMNQL